MMFKVGDRVRIEGNCSVHIVGHIGTIVRVERDLLDVSGYEVIIPNHTYPNYPSDASWGFYGLSIEYLKAIIIHPDHQCSQCQVPLPHVELEQKLCLTCQIDQSL